VPPSPPFFDTLPSLLPHRWISSVGGFRFSPFFSPQAFDLVKSLFYPHFSPGCRLRRNFAFRSPFFLKQSFARPAPLPTFLFSSLRPSAVLTPPPFNCFVALLLCLFSLPTHLPWTEPFENALRLVAKTLPAEAVLAFFLPPIYRISRSFPLRFYRPPPFFEIPPCSVIKKNCAEFFFFFSSPWPSLVSSQMGEFRFPYPPSLIRLFLDSFSPVLSLPPKNFVCV